VLFGGDIVSYVVWAVSPDGTYENLGGIANEDVVKATATYSTAKRDFAMMITAEPIRTVRTPGALVVFFSGTPGQKDVQPTGFTFGGLSDRGYVVSLSGVAFPTGESALKTEGKYVLAKLSGVMLAFDDVKLSIEGHTDSTGSEETNRKLSLARADSVKTFLTEMDVSASIMTTEGFGPDKPLMPNDTPEGRARNRRVEIVMVDAR
jgi:outer membrane protein OmpA-like peptidoglycan-associated protein